MTAIDIHLTDNTEYQEAPYLSFEEAMIYTGMGPNRLSAFLLHAMLPFKHISRRRLDAALTRAGENWVLKRFAPTSPSYWRAH